MMIVDDKKINDINVICSHTKKPCDNVRDIQYALEDIRRAIGRSVLLGAAIGSGLAQGLVDLLRAWM